MRRFALVALLALSLGGCAQLKAAWQAFEAGSNAQVSPTAVIVAVNSFDAVEATATQYLRLPKCGAPGATAICRAPAATAEIVPAIKIGRKARNDLEAFMKAHPGQLGPSGLFDALTAATTTLQAIIAQYHIGGR